MLIRPSPCSAGFSLIEVLITLAIFGMLMAMAAPNFSSTVQDAQVRSTGQSILTGLQLARAEAIHRNVLVQVQFTNQLAGAPTAGGTDWQIKADKQSNPPASDFTVDIQDRSGAEGAHSVRIGAKAALDFSTPAAHGNLMPLAIVFNGLGRVAANTPAQIDIVSMAGAAGRRLSITISPGGQVRLCDPALQIATDPRGCA